MKFSKVLLLFTLNVGILSANAIDISLGNAAPFAVLAYSTVTNTGPSVVSGNIGLTPGTSITGFPPGILAPPSMQYTTGGVAMAARTDAISAYQQAVAESCNSDLTGQNLGGQTLTPGVYCFMSSAQITGNLTLNGNGDPNAIFVFQVGSALTTASTSSVIFQGGAQGSGVFWQVGTSATLGTDTDFAGTIIAAASITLDTRANINCGRAFALTGAVTTG